MSERHDAATEAEQQVVFDLLRDRLYRLFGPGGSFRVTLGRATEDDAMFMGTIADVVAHDVATAFAPVRTTSARRRRDVSPTLADHELMWKQIEVELLIRRSGPESIAVEIERELAAARRSRPLAHRAA